MADSVAYFVDPTGQTVELPAEQAASAQSLGYVPASPEEAAAFRRADEEARTYGSTGQQAMAGVEAAARALTFGLSTPIETALGIDPEGIAARERVNPTAAGVGTGLGILGPALVTGGLAGAAEGAAAGAGEAVASGALRTAAELSAPAIAARAGRAVTRGVESLLPAAESLPGELARRAVSSGLGSAVEGAFYGAGQVVHEAALGDPHLTAENALSEIGLSAALGGGLGAVGGLAGGVLGHLSGSAGESGIAARVRDWLGDVEGERNFKAAGAIQSDLTRVRKQIGREELNQIAREGGELGLVGPFSTPEKTLERSQQLMEQAGERIGEVLRTADANARPGVLPTWEEIAEKVSDKVLRPMAGDPFREPIAERLSGIVGRYEQRFPGGLRLEDLHQIRREISNELYGLRGNMDPGATFYKDALHDVRSIVSDELREGVERAGIAGDAWKTANREYQVASKFAEFAEKGLDRAVGNNRVPLTTILGGIGGGNIAGPAGAAAGAAASYLSRQYASGIGGWAAGTLRRAIEGGAPRAVIEGTEQAAAIEARQLATPTVDAIRRAAPDLAEAAPVARQEFLRLQDRIGAVADALKAEPKRFPATYAQKLDEVRQTLLSTYRDELPAAEAHAVIERAASELAPLSRLTGERLLGHAEASAVVRQLRNELRAALTVPEVWGEQAAESAARRLAREASAAAARDARAQALAALERANNTSRTRISAASSALVRASDRLASVGRSEALAGVGKVFSRTPEDAASLFTRRSRRINELANNPAAMQSVLEQQSGDLYEHAPDTATALGAASTRAVTYLASVMPVPKDDGLGGTLPPSRAEIAAFNRRYEAVANPDSVLKQAAAGTLTPEAVEAVKAVYPRRFEVMRQEIEAKLLTHGPPPYQTQLMLSMLLGQPLRSSLSPLAIRAYQQAMAAPTKRPSQHTKAPNLAANTLTPLQRAAGR